MLQGMRRMWSRENQRNNAGTRNQRNNAGTRKLSLNRTPNRTPLINIARIKETIKNLIDAENGFYNEKTLMQHRKEIDEFNRKIEVLRAISEDHLIVATQEFMKKFDIYKTDFGDEENKTLIQENREIYYRIISEVSLMINR